MNIQQHDYTYHDVTNASCCPCDLGLMKYVEWWSRSRSNEFTLGQSMQQSVQGMYVLTLFMSKTTKTEMYEAFRLIENEAHVGL